MRGRAEEGRGRGGAHDEEPDGDAAARVKVGQVPVEDLARVDLVGRRGRAGRRGIRQALAALHLREAALLCQLAVVVGSRGGVRVVVQRVHVVAVKLDLAPGFAPADDGPAPSETAAMSCALRGEVRVRLAAQVGEGREAAGSHRKVGELDVAAHVALLVAHRGELAGDGHGWDLRGGGRGWAGRATAGGRLVGPSLLTCVVRRASQTRSP